MTFKLLSTVAALAVVLPVAAHAEGTNPDPNKTPQRQMERSQYDGQRAPASVPNQQATSAAERNAAAVNRGATNDPAALNEAAPASGNESYSTAQNKKKAYNE